LGKDQALFPVANQTNVQYGLRWAEVSATPLRLSKGFTTEGGTSAPAIVHLPGQTGQLPTLRDFIHVRDSAPTLLEVAGITPSFGTAPPAQLTAAQGSAQIPRVSYNGNYVYPITGKSAFAELQGGSVGPLHAEPVGEEQYGRAYIRQGQWKATFLEPPWGPLDGHWQLYDIVNDRAETNDVSAQHPDVVQQLYQAWRDYLYNSGGIDPVRPLGYY
jgi:arylsulfatase